MKKPLISNQHGALVMAFIPFLYGIFASHWTFAHFWLGLTWLFVYLFSYPFLALFHKKETAKYKKWAIIYASFAIITAAPLLFSHISILQFIIPVLCLSIIQIYFAKQKNERHLINDIAGFLIFGIVGIASFYLSTNQYNIEILLHPTLFFIATTFYVKSVARERKNPLYLKLSVYAHLLLTIIYFCLNYFPISIVYLLGLFRAIVIPKLKWSIKKVGITEFIVAFCFILSLYLISR